MEPVGAEISVCVARMSKRACKTCGSGRRVWVGSGGREKEILWTENRREYVAIQRRTFGKSS